MECQVNVAQDGGTRTGGEYKGVKWNGWTDDLTVWKPFRIPRSANTSPEYTDSEIKFDLAQHAEAIGMTGWNWVDQQSEWVAFDFDAIVGHTDKHTKNLTIEQLDQIKNLAMQIPWVTIRKSTSGNGLHFYVFLDPVKTANHVEHAALARAILGKMSAFVGFDFKSLVDICGGNMWVWARKMKGTDGLKVIKSGTRLTQDEIPPNWRDHLSVISGRRKRNIPKDLPSNVVENFDQLTGQSTRIPLDDEHRRLIQYLQENHLLWWWDQDHHMLITHTIHLKSAHIDLALRGFYETLSDGHDPNTQNCFAFPYYNGSWLVRRYTVGVKEHTSWSQDGVGWTVCYFNREADFDTTCRAFSGIENPKGGYIFKEAETATQAARLLGVELNLPIAMNARETVMRKHRDGRLLVEVDRESDDAPLDNDGWYSRGNKPWTKIFNLKLSDPLDFDIGAYDDILRHVVSKQNEDCGWVINRENVWGDEPLHHIRIALTSLGLSNKEITSITGTAILKPWTLINQPFQPEYPGDRRWNRNAAQLKYAPSPDKDNLHYPHWIAILNHCGSGLDQQVKEDTWCMANSILTGGDYLKCWITSLIKDPIEPLPYLFFYGPQNSGKTIFHEALSLLFTKGYKRADQALVSQGGFNAELEGSLVCVIEETDLRKNVAAYNRMKDWVTSRDILVHAKGETPYHAVNTTHWIQCSNDHQACPVFAGDTRITICYVEPLLPETIIPKRQLITMLEKEAPDFLAAIMDMELPPSPDRLNIPVIASADKRALQQINSTALESFIDENCDLANGASIKYSDFWERFQASLDPGEEHFWTIRRMGKELPPYIIKGRNRSDAQWHLGNIKWKTDETQPTGKFVLGGEFLVWSES